MRLIVTDLAVDRGAGIVFDGVGFSLADGEGLLVTGPNGAGKSTLIRAVAGLLRPSAGSARIEDAGARWPTVAAASHYLGPANAMKPALSVAENLSFWQAFHGSPQLSVDEALATVGLGHTRDLPFSYLSTGQRRRVAIARLLLNFRPVWLLDEPTSGLDAASEAHFAGLVRDHLRAGGIVVAATHLPIAVDGMKRLEFAVARAA
ncbi:heme ABC exporter ATP-binding protein CcmA [Oricola thermophila]|uniref:Heme ABC exporter ATP-binding protein CcmA n=1 Tax=Oricola thermophila TaxID=2742145 RepID=A0A6N1VHI2_9HYPH|nr:heme ABC exporter ATP-binding protein CcmA [Oricola thermophila]QKV19903.1 heme ABC exporter ATP-binding protein CcmA [Oricola thermophila]